jgi:type II secretory pathway pseudopilin PulG
MMIAFCQLSPQKNHKRGFSLIEIMLVIGVSMLIAIGGFILYRSLSESRQIKEAVDKFGTIVALARGFYDDAPTDAVSSARLASANVLAPDMVTSSWGNINIDPAQDGVACASNCSDFGVGYVSVPASSCGRLINSLEPNSGYIYVYGGFNAYVKSPTVPFSVATVGTACRSAATVTVYFWPS